MKQKDMFYSDSPNNYDGRCADCPFVVFNTIGGDICSETGQDVSWIIRHGRVNKLCPFRNKGG